MGVITLFQCLSLSELNAWEDERLVEIGALQQVRKKKQR
jgi:hypothetical protein